MRYLLLLIALSSAPGITAQELYVFTEPASNVPANSLSILQSVKGLNNLSMGRNEQRYNTQLTYGMNRKLQISAGTTFSNMYAPSLRFESVRLYGKYRFYSRDGMYRHFRMAAFAAASYNPNDLQYDELGLEGDNSGWQLGITGTQLLHKLAVSASASVIDYTGTYVSYSRNITQPFTTLNYSLSAGYLLLPKDYTNYDQVNVNLYLEILGQKAMDQPLFMIDAAPAVQLIFKSQAKLNFGYRRQLAGNMFRMSDQSWLIELEWLFLNVIRKR